MKAKAVTGSSKGIKPLQPCSGRKEDSVNLVLRIREEIWTKHDALDVINLGIIIEIVLNLKKDKRN